MDKPKQRNTGGSVLLEKHGPEYFSKLAKKGWKKRDKALKAYALSVQQLNLANRKKVT